MTEVVCRRHVLKRDIGGPWQVSLLGRGCPEMPRDPEKGFENTKMADLREVKEGVFTQSRYEARGRENTSSDGEGAWGAQAGAPQSVLYSLLPLCHQKPAICI